MCIIIRERERERMLVFEERGKQKYPEKNLSEQGSELTTNSTHIWCSCQDLNPGNIGGRRVLSLLCHPCSPLKGEYKGLQGVTRGYRGLTEGYKGLQGVTGGYKGLHGLTGGYK